MGMFDAPQYLTGGSEPYVKPGDTFWLHNARIDGTVKIAGDSRDQAKLRVSRTRDGEQTTVYTAGVAIVNQVRRMDDGDRRAMPVEVRLDQIPSKQGSPTNVLTPAAQETPAARAADDEIPF